MAASFVCMPFRLQLVTELPQLADGDERNEAEEQQEQEEEERARPEQERAVDERRPVVTPRRREEIPALRRDDQDEALRPHADLDHQRQEPQRHGAPADTPEPQQL